jgi:hypothetical protein
LADERRHPLDVGARVVALPIEAGAQDRHAAECMAGSGVAGNHVPRAPPRVRSK